MTSATCRRDGRIEACHRAQAPARQASSEGRRASSRWFGPQPKRSGKTLSEHKADRTTVVREALMSAGIDAPELDRMAASVILPDGSPRFVWTDTRPDADIYARVILASIFGAAAVAHPLRSREGLPGACGQSFGNRPATLTLHSAGRRDHTSASPDPGPHLVEGKAVNGERSESEGHERSECR